MSVCSLVFAVRLFVSVPLLHGAPLGQPPVPHWVVLLVVVPALWGAIGGAVVVVDRLLEVVETATKQ